MVRKYKSNKKFVLLKFKWYHGHMSKPDIYYFDTEKEMLALRRNMIFRCSADDSLVRLYNLDSLDLPEEYTEKDELFPFWDEEKKLLVLRFE